MNLAQTPLMGKQVQHGHNRGFYILKLAHGSSPRPYCVCQFGWTPKSHVQRYLTVTGTPLSEHSKYTTQQGNFTSRTQQELQLQQQPHLHFGMWCTIVKPERTNF